MRQRTVVTILVILTLIVLALAAFLVIKKYRTKQVQTREQILTEAQIECAKDVRIAQLELELQYLEERLAECEAKTSTTTTSTPRATTTTRRTTTPRTTTPRAVPAPTTQRLTPSAQPAASPAGSPSKANLTHLRDINGEIIFCVMANNDGGLHFPQFALERGVRFTAVQANPTQDGSNWIVEPITEISGDYGLLTDGTFFVRHDVIERVLQGSSQSLTSLAIKTSFTGWQAREMERVGDFWIIKLLPNL